MLCVKFGWIRSSGSGGKKCLRLRLPLDIDCILPLNTLESPSPKNYLYLVWLKLAQHVVLYVSVMTMPFWYFIFLERDGSFICTKSNLIYPEIHSDKFGWNWTSVLEKIFFTMLLMYFRYFAIFTPCERMDRLLEQTWIRSPNDIFCKIWFKLAQR